MNFDKALAFTAVTVSLTTTIIAAVVMTPTTARSTNSEIKVSLSNEELDIMFGKDRPKQIGPHKIVYLTNDEAKQVKGQAGPLTGPIIQGIIWGAAGAGGAYISGQDARGIAVGALSGASGGFLGGFAGTVGGPTVGALAGAYGAFGTTAGCYNCHGKNK